jgi:hypothetical protein
MKITDPKICDINAQNSNNLEELIQLDEKSSSNKQNQ